MEVFTVLLSLAIILLPLILLWRRGSGAKLPRGSFGWPIIGETMEFLYGKPEKFVGDRMRKYSPDIFKTKILGEKTAVICGPKGHKFIFSNEQTYFSSFRPHPMQYLFRSYKLKSAAPAPSEVQRVEEVKVVRQPGFFKPEALMRYLSKMDCITQEQLRIHCDENESDVVKIHPLCKTITLTLASQFFLGVDNPERIARLVEYFDCVTLGMHSVMINLPGTAFYRANVAAAALRKELAAVIREKKQAMADSETQNLDILSHLINITGGSGEAEVADKIMGMLTAGYSTVATAMTFLVKYLGIDQEVYEKVRAEQMEISAGKKEGELLQWEDMSKMKYSWNVIMETMRLVPPLQGTFREVVQEFDYAGYTVPKGWKVYWTVSTTNMNPEYFPQPEKFNPSRFEGSEAPPPYTSVPFGAGPRMCIGKEYARIAMLAFLHNMVKRYRWEVVDPSEKVEGDMMPEPEKGLPVRLYPR